MSVEPHGTARSTGVATARQAREEAQRMRRLAAAQRRHAEQQRATTVAIRSGARDAWRAVEFSRRRLQQEDPPRPAGG